ncbi:hypothetical protein F7984_07850 [Pradoshia sp. D12]|uniref:hypothetical protein n=1 Tax=Bacillaceae TaxID=186817 RepID=UPI0011210D35|nr:MULTISPECIES: hypothetical protein [Bacillaceae]QFK71166.1 hypothetical protein F7984_07850 [Pradoshia sp. D12]TPF72959.1 hypothetical protein FHY44_04240 [Bacillus sp. D12]
MIEFYSWPLLKNYLITEYDFQEHGLEEAFSTFERKVILKHGLTTSAQPATFPFNWLTEDGVDVTLNFAFIFDEEEEEKKYAIVMY